MTAVVVAAVGLGLVVPTAAPADCMGPVLAVPDDPDQVLRWRVPEPAEPPRLGPGSTVTVRGAGFYTECDDVGVSSGCVRHQPQGAVGPARDVRLELVGGGGRRWLLGTVDAAGAQDEFATRWDVEMPEDIAPGPAELRAGSAVLPVVIGP